MIKVGPWLSKHTSNIDKELSSLACVFFDIDEDIRIIRWVSKIYLEVYVIDLWWRYDTIYDIYNFLIKCLLVACKDVFFPLLTWNGVRCDTG